MINIVVVLTVIANLPIYYLPATLQVTRVSRAVYLEKQLTKTAQYLSGYVNFLCEITF